MPPQDIPALRERLDGSNFNAITAGTAVLAQLTPHSPDALNAASDLAETDASARAAVPSGDTTIQRLPNGRYLVHDPTTGEEIGQAPNRKAAARMAQRAAEHSNPPADSGDGDSASDDAPSLLAPSNDESSSLSSVLDSDLADAEPEPLSESDVVTTGDALGDEVATLRIVSDQGGFRVIDSNTGSEIGFEKSFEEATAITTRHGGSLVDGCDIEVYHKQRWSDDQQQAAAKKCEFLDKGDTTVRRSIEREESEQRNFRRQNKTPAQFDADHKVDLQLGGSPHEENIWALDKSVNRSIGAQIQHRIRNLPDGTRINRVQIKHR